MSIESRSNQYGRVFDHWQIQGFLGQGSGGKSAVFRLTRTDSNRGNSALKVINLIEERGQIDNLSDARLHDYESIREVCKRSAEQEVWLMDSLQGNTNIVDYLDHTFVDWADETGFGRDMLIRMELLADLRGKIREGETFEESEVLKIGKDICTALILCHGKNILHRDIKPENIFVNKNGDYKLGDFGVSKILGSAPTAMASTGVGTPEYAAPEQSSGHYDTRVDIYSLGLVLYELSNKNRLPFATSGYVRPEEVQKRILGTPLPAPSEASEGLWAVIEKACAYKPQDRYQSAQEFLEALVAVSGGELPPVLAQQPEQVYDAYQTAPANELGASYATMPASAPEMAGAYMTMPATAGEMPAAESYATVPAFAQDAKPVPQEMPAQPAAPAKPAEPARPAAPVQPVTSAQPAASDIPRAPEPKPMNLGKPKSAHPGLRKGVTFAITAALLLAYVAFFVLLIPVIVGQAISLVNWFVADVEGIQTIVEDAGKVAWSAAVIIGLIVLHYLLLGGAIVAACFFCASLQNAGNKLAKNVKYTSKGLGLMLNDACQALRSNPASTDRDTLKNMQAVVEALKYAKPFGTSKNKDVLQLEDEIGELVEFLQNNASADSTEVMVELKKASQTLKQKNTFRDQLLKK